jgi:hypothetical protein
MLRHGFDGDNAANKRYRCRQHFQERFPHALDDLVLVAANRERFAEQLGQIPVQTWDRAYHALMQLHPQRDAAPDVDPDMLRAMSVELADAAEAIDGPEIPD